MKPLYSKAEYDNAKWCTILSLECESCGATFHRMKYIIRKDSPKFCSLVCSGMAHRVRVIVSCAYCAKVFEKFPSQISATNNNFCSKSCAAKYNNKHKTSGTRRSKLEIYLEQQIELNYPCLHCSYNSKDTIGSELDFYFPTLKLAIELNGILHYEPIYGADKLERIQDNDKQKAIRCYELGIEFCTIDTSTCKNLTQAQKSKYWTIFKDLLDSVIARHSAAFSI